MTINAKQSKVAFLVKKMGFIKVNGTLSQFSGQVTFDENDLAASSFDVCVASASISTDNPKRDEHLKNADFFDVEQHPTISFKSSKVEADQGQFKTTGE